VAIAVTIAISIPAVWIDRVFIELFVTVVILSIATLICARVGQRIAIVAVIRSCGETFLKRTRHHHALAAIPIEIRVYEPGERADTGVLIITVIGTRNAIAIHVKPRVEIIA